MVMRQPSLSAPTRFARGTITSEKKTSANSARCEIWCSGRTSMPGESMSMISAEMPLWRGTSGSVRT